MRKVCLITNCSLLVLLVSTGFAGAEAQEVRDYDRWSVGAGVGLHSVHGNVYGIGGLGPSARVMMEYGLSPSLSFMVHATGSYFRPSLDSPSYSIGMGADGGLRLVFNPDSPVEVSAFWTLGYNWFRTRSHGYCGFPQCAGLASLASASGGDFDPKDTEVTDKAITTGIGLAFEVRLMDNLILRLAGRLASASWSWTEAEFLAEDTGRLTANLEFSPEIQLRMTF